MNNHSANSYEVTERRKMQKVKLLDIIEKPLSGEWGSEAEDGNGVLVLRTTNFTNEGIINFNSVVRRDLGNKNVDKKYLKKGDIIIEKSGGSDNQPVGRVVYFEAENNKYLFNNFTSVLRVKTDIAFPKYIFYCLFYKYKIGATRPFENKTTGLHNLKLEQYINSILIMLPPIEEQRAIAEKLDNVSQLVDKRKEQLQQLDQLVKSQFIDMFGDPKQNPKGWEQTLLKNVAIGKLSYGSGASAIEYDGQTRYIRITDITETGGLIEDAKSPNVFDEKYLLNSGDILFARSGATVGKTFCYNSNMGRCIFAGYLIRFVPNTDKVLPEYIFNYTKTEHYANFVKDCQRAVAQPNINAQEYGNLIICVPPMELQKQFAEFVERVDKLKEKVNNSLTQLNLLKQSLMQQYFN